MYVFKNSFIMNFNIKIRVFDMTRIRYDHTLILKIIWHNIWYIHIENVQLFKKNDNYIIIFIESKLKSNILNIFNIKFYKLLCYKSNWFTYYICITIRYEYVLDTNTWNILKYKSILISISSMSSFSPSLSLYIYIYIINLTIFLKFNYFSKLNK